MQPKKIISALLKIAVSAAMLGYLGYQAYHDERFLALAAGPKNWPILLCALPICLTAVLIAILRWHMLVRTLGLDFTVRDALRAGFIGNLVNLMPFGLVGGDSLKAVLLIHRNANQKTEAVASVLIDRVIGLYALLLLAAVASLFLPVEQLQRLAAADRVVVERLTRVVQTASIISTIGLIVLLIPGVTHSRLWDLFEKTPLMGSVLHRLVEAVRKYRRRLDRLLAAIGASLGIHLLYVLAMITLTIGLRIPEQQRPAVGSFFIIIPPAMIAGALPIGAYEVALNILYRSVSPMGAPQNIGILLAFGYRLIQVSIATIGVGYWLTSRGEVKEIIHEIEDIEPDGLEPAEA